MAPARSIGSSGLDRIGFLPAAATWARLAEYQEIHSWYGTNRPEFREQVRDLPFRFYEPLPAGSKMHATSFYCAQVGAPDSNPRLPLPAIPPAEPPFAILHPFASTVGKRWPLTGFREVAAALENALPVAWCAGPEEELEGATRFTALDDLARWIASARLYIGNDSGITHLAAALGVPTLALFGPTDPAVWGPRGERVSIVRAGSLPSLSAAEVLAAVEFLL